MTENLWLANCVVNLQNPAMRELEAKVLFKALAMTLQSMHYTAYHGRKGSVIIDGQPVVRNDMSGLPTVKKRRGTKPNLASIGFGEAQMVTSIDLPGGREKTYDFDTMEMAAQAIDALLDGDYDFSHHANMRLASGIYYPYGEDRCTLTVGALMVLEATYGRFLVGIGDQGWLDPKLSYNLEVVLVTIGRILTWMFPDDQYLQTSYDWTKRHCRAEKLYYSDAESVVDQLFRDPAFEEFGELKREFWDGERYPFYILP